MTWIGHSEGTTQLLAGGALMPEYFNEKINLAVFFAPPFGMIHMPDPVDRAASNPLVMPGLIKLLDDVHLWNFLPYGSLEAHATSGACHLFNGEICKYFLKYVMGGDPKIDYYERADVILSNMPSGSGYLNM